MARMWWVLVLVVSGCSSRGNPVEVPVETVVHRVALVKKATAPTPRPTPTPTPATSPTPATEAAAPNPFREAEAEGPAENPFLTPAADESASPAANPFLF